MTLAFARNVRRHCSRCGKDLEDPASEERGVGPVCAGKDTTLFARTIQANFAGATAILLSIRPENLPVETHLRFESMKNVLLSKAEKATQAANDCTNIHLDGQDLRPIIKEIDWMLSHRMDAQVRRFFVRMVKFLGYVELAAVLSQEASTTPAKVWFEASNGRIFLKGKACKPGFMAMRQISGISFPRYRGSEDPYSAPASQVDKFLNVVQDYWPMYEGDIEEFRKQAKEWLATQVAPVVAPRIAAAPRGPVASMQMVSVGMGPDAGNWLEVAFPWIFDKGVEMYALVGELKTVPYRDRKYNPNTKTWMFRQAHQEKVQKALEKLFTIEKKGMET
jgi:hypothetical protein